MLQLQWAIIRPKTEQSPGTFNDCALIECTIIECTSVQYGGENIRNYIQYFLHLVLFSVCEFLLTVFVLRVLSSSYVYLLYLMCIIECTSVQYGGKNIRNYIQYFLHLLLFSVCTFLLTVFVLRVLSSSYVFICCTLCVFVVLCVYCCSYFRCQTAG